MAASATVEPFDECSGGFGSGSNWDNADRTYLACGSSVRVYTAAGEFERSIALPFAVSDVAPSPDGAHLYVARGKDAPKRLNRKADGSYAVDAAWAPASYLLDGATVTPQGHWLATDNDGFVYLADGAWTDADSNTVIKYTPEGTVVTRFGAKKCWANTLATCNSWETGFFYWQLNGIGVSRDGSRVYTVEGGNDRLQFWDRQADGTYKVTGTLGSTEANHGNREGDNCNYAKWTGEFASSYDMGIDGAGNIYVLNTTCIEVNKFSPAGTFLASYDLRNPSAVKPHGFAVTRNGHVFVPQAQRVIRNGDGGGGGQDPTDPADPAVTCHKWADTQLGNDYGGHDGSSAKPFATVYKLVNSLGAGQTGCLRAGQAFGEPQGEPNWDKHINNPKFVQIKASGEPGNPITIRSGPGDTPASFTGQLEAVGSEDPEKPNAHDIVLRNITFKGSGTLGKTHLILNGDNISLLDNNITTSKGICVNAGMFQTYDDAWYAENGVMKLPDVVATDLTISGNRIHHCGSASTDQDLGESGVHGIYLVNTVDAKVTNNYIYSNAVRGVQMYPKAHRTLVANNVIDGNSSSVNIGSCWQAARSCTRKAYSTDTVVENNIITNSTFSFRDDTHQIFANFPFTSRETYGNVVRGNCVWPQGDKNFGNLGSNGITYGFVGGPADNAVADPRYVNRAAGNFSMPVDSPCAGKGPTTDTPSPSPTPSLPPSPSPSPSPSPTATPSVVVVHPRGVTMRLLHRSGRLVVKGGIYVDDKFFTCSQQQRVEILRNGTLVTTTTTNVSYSAFTVSLRDRTGRYTARVAEFNSGTDKCPAASVSRRHSH